MKKYTLRIFAISLFITMMVTVFYIPFAQASSLEDAIDQQNSVESKLTDLLTDKKELNDQISDSLDEISKIQTEKEKSMSEMDQLLAQMDEIYDAMTNLDNTISNTEAEYKAKEDLLYERATVMYQYSEYSVFELLLDSDNLLEFVSRTSYYNDMVETDKQLMQDLVVIKFDLVQKKVVQQNIYANKEALLAEKEAMYKKIQNNEAIIQADYQQSYEAFTALMIEEDKLEGTAKSIEAEVKKLQDEEEARKKAAANTNSGSSSSNNSTPANLDWQLSNMLWPAQKGTYISSYYGNRMHPIYHVMRFHNGIDIPAPGGSNILAAAGGKVITASYNSGYGNYVVIYHGNGYSTLYAHSSKILVSVGQTVSRGDVIALVGTTGSSTGNHLHFEVLIDGSSRNPLNYLVR